MSDRDKMLRVRMTDDELIMLKTVADARGLSGSDVVRLGLRAEFAKFAKEHGQTAAECLEVVRHRTHMPTAPELEEPIANKVKREQARTRGR